MADKQEKKLTRPPVKRNFQALMRKKIQDAGVIDTLIEVAMDVNTERAKKYDVEDKDRLRILEKLAVKVLPDMKAVEISGDADRPVLVIRDLSGAIINEEDKS